MLYQLSYRPMSLNCKHLRQLAGVVRSVGVRHGVRLHLAEPRQPFHRILLVLGAEVAVAHGGLQYPVTCQLSHGCDVHASHGETRAKGRPEAVAAKAMRIRVFTPAAAPPQLDHFAHHQLGRALARLLAVGAPDRASGSPAGTLPPR